MRTWVFATGILLGSLRSMAADSCIELACSYGHCRYYSDAVLNACAGANAICVKEACSSNLDCKYESDFVLKEQACSPQTFLLQVPPPGYKKL